MKLKKLAQSTLLLTVVAVTVASAQTREKNKTVPENQQSGGIINAPGKGYNGTVDSFDNATGVLRVKDGAGTVTSYKVTPDTTVMEKGSAVTSSQINEGDSVIVYPKTVTTSNELKKVELL